ncbi:hypothetical protein DXG01_004609 [Tephrocybe rancida]|nr:hypothetical protein DXG01_004609 [Tephrocybe rancida]
MAMAEIGNLLQQASGKDLSSMLDIDSDTIPGTMLNEFDFKALTESILKTHLCQLDFFKGEGFDTIERGDITTHIVGDFDPSESELIKSLSPADAIHRHHPAALGT